MNDILKQNPGVRTEYLKVSEGGVYLAPTLVQTVLGSCLGMAFHAPEKGVGAFFHAFLPRQADYEPQGGSPAYKFVDTAVDHMLKQFARLGVKPMMLGISLMGGAHGLVDERAGVGLKNVQAAYEALEKRRIRPKFVDVGGGSGRKVFFLSSTGQLEIVKLKGFTPL